ncbi:hypothetical protein LR48_Vigan02g032400 [Vigna angularis]|uniref:Uncharacterized protein n=1 Tax=Phaseolus angularis TaxID=3914 RepID=A0A0L9TVG4_PHAAN|nr:hypothetical protein LR48_Vigan02g032400 [Vigna angularis]
MNGKGGKSCWKSEEGMKEKQCCKRKKDDEVKVEGREKVVNESCSVWKNCDENGSNKERKAAWEDAEMDPEIQHLIETIWEVDNCPPMLTGEITLQLKPKPPLPPRPKLQRVYKIQDLMSSTNQGPSSSL